LEQQAEIIQGVTVSTIQINQRGIAEQWGQPDCENGGGANAASLGGAAGYPGR